MYSSEGHFILIASALILKIFGTKKSAIMIHLMSLKARRQQKREIF